MLILGGALAFGACSGLEPIDYSDINPNIFPKNEEDVLSLVNGAYYTFRSDWFDGMFANDDRGIMFINDLTTEILTATGNWMYNVSTFNYFPTTGDVTRIYYSNTDYTHTNGKKADGYANDVSKLFHPQSFICNFLLLNLNIVKKLVTVARSNMQKRGHTV